jgi:expansin (peptidoglycan-binding protein)
MRETVFWLGITVLAAACAADDDDSAEEKATTAMEDDNASPSESPSTPAVACGEEPERDGEATYYDFADGSGACGFPATPDDLMVGAMNAPDYGNSAPCGACAHVVGPEGEVTVRVVDLCPECPEGHIDLSPEAFERIAPIEHGRVPIRWQYVPCDVSGPVVYHFKDGSNEWWTALQLRNIRHAVAKLEYERDGEFVTVSRLDYNYFVEESGMGPGPLTLRVTDVHGAELVDRDIAPGDDIDRSGAAQFPACQ